ncbi:MAG: family 10 glycosylhydrolase [Verrucomicrobia bacterium]|nr:family 10 glycosylhydrolase [Verrucomicrobiota bacterium]
MGNDCQKRAGGFLLGLILWLTLAGTAAADREKTFDLFAFRKAAEAPQTWKACNGSPAVAYEPASPSGVRFPGLFGANTDRVYWDRAVSLDLRGYDLLELDLTCTRPDAIQTFALYLKSGDGWYLWFAPLKESSRQKLFFPITDAAVEGKPAGWDAISAVRISLTREARGAWSVERKGGTEQAASVMAHGLKARACDLVIVQGTLSMANAGERTYARSRTKRISRWLQDFGLGHSVVDDEAVVAGRLKSARLAILPYNSLPPDKELRALESFVKRGGKLMVFYSAEPKLAELMGLKLGRYQTAKVAGQWSSFAFNKHASPLVPKVVYQDSSNILPAYPANDDARIIATWQNSAGKDLADPAWVQSPHGLWMSHVLLDSDAVNKQRMLLALLGAYVPSFWEQSAARVMARTGKVGPFINLNDAVTGITRMARGTSAEESVSALLAQCGQDYKIMSAALAKRKYAEVVETGQHLQTKLVEAFARVQRPENPEFRGVWDHTGLGLYPGNWPKTARILADAGMHAVFVNVLWAGLAHYDSQVVPQSETVSRYGDQLKQCVAAAHANRLEVHVWKICWNLSNAPESFLAAMRKAGRLQVTDTGKELKWLCPSHPDNVALELKAVSEVLNRYPVDGIHLDYVRYPNANACFCTGCRRRFGRRLGEKIPDWPKSAQSGNLRGKYNAWRSEQITAFVRAVQTQARKSGVPTSTALRHSASRRRERVRISAAVYPEYPGCINSIGQDWGRWLKEDLVDFVCPMDYTTDNDAFKDLVRRQLALPSAGGRVFPGLGVTAMESQLTPDQVIEQIRQTREAGAGGFVLFDLNRTLEHDVLPALRMGLTRP